MQAFCAALGFVGYSCTPENAALQQKFLEHMSTYGLSYGTTDELHFRFDQFSKTNKHIEEKNADPTLTYVSGHNKFSTWTDAEFEHMLGKLDTPLVTENETCDLPSSIEDSLDWRARNKVKPVQDQGNCGSCWGFSVAAAIESSYTILKN
mmetsp:Transcript_7828/g.12127  ORF Transcript_7828/g.12127 Transcript_7828/m.12127 type:complete len:150 (+) Transcript_7828:19-468(+)